MYGLEAINANNGWAISVVGVSTVFTGLVMLSIVIAQLHKVLALWEDPSKIKALFRSGHSKKKRQETEQNRMPLTESQKQTAKQFALLARTLEDHFSLPRLLHLARISGLQEPYSTLTDLLKTNIIIPDSSGFFTWDSEMFDKIISY